MLTEPLPKTLDVRKAAARGITVSGSLNLSEMTRFNGMLADCDGQVSAELAFAKDEENRFVLRATAQAEVRVLCQRCLEPMPLRVEADNKLAIVWSDEQARHLPKHLDPWIADEERADLWSVVEDELILAMPFVSYHAPEDCQQTITGSGDAEEPSASDDRPNPFDVLEQLKPGKK